MNALKSSGSGVCLTGGGKAVAQENAIGGGGESVGAVSGEIFRSERAALSREAAGGAPGGDQLQLGERAAARGRDGGQGAERGVHRQRQARRPLPGMLLHIDGSEHRWFQDERWYDFTW